MRGKTLSIATASTLLAASCGSPEAEPQPFATLPAIEVDAPDDEVSDFIVTTTTTTVAGATAVGRMFEEDSSDPDDTVSCEGICGPAIVYAPAERLGNQIQVGTTITPPTTIGENCRPVAIPNPDGSITTTIVCD
jgi:hypothetical protein